MTICEAEKRTIEMYPNHEGCCCRCLYLAEDHSHPVTDGGHVTEQRGWACLGFRFTEGENVIFSGWTQHGMCEMFTPIPAKEVI